MNQTTSLDALPSRNQPLLDQVREAVLVPLAAFFTDVQDALADALFQLAERAGAGQNDYLEAIELLRRQREPIAARFRAHLAQAWQALEAGRPLSVERTLVRNQSDLNLVSEHELDVRLAVRNLAGAVQHHWRPELMRLDRYLGFIAGGLRIDADTNPFGPEHVGAAVYAAFHGEPLAPRAHLAVVKLCEPPLVERVGQLYAGLEQSLAELSRLRDLPAARARRQGIPRSGETATDDADAPDWIARFFSGWSGGRSALASAQAIDVHVREDQDVLPPALRQLLQDARLAREAGAAGTLDERRALSPRELLSALSLLQTSPQAGFEAIQEGDAGLARGLRREVMGAVASLGVDPASSRIDPADEDTLDLVGMLFEVILAESQLLPPQRELIGQLLVPMAKVALLDSRLFVRDSHPARRLLNLLADACDGNAGETPAEQALLTQVQAAVDRIVRDFDENLALFLALESGFGAGYEQYRRRVEIAERRTSELQRAEERRERARGVAAAALAERLARGPLPPAVEQFLQQVWSVQVQQAALRGDGQGAALEEALALGDFVLEQHARARAGAASDAAWPPPREKALLQAFVQAGLSGPQAEGALRQLHRALQPGAVSEPAAPAPALPLAAPVQPAEPGGETLTPLLDDPEAAEFDHVTADYFRALATGTWLDFVDREGRVQSGKLAWTSPISGRLMFVNRRGGRLCVASPEELAMMVWLDRLRLHRDGDAFYSAMQGVVDELEHVQPA